MSHEGDSGREGATEASGFSNTLVGPVNLQVDYTDVTDNFDVYYRSDRYPTLDANAELESNEWTTSPTYYCNVTALKIISKDDFTLGDNQILHATLDMRAPAYSGTDLNGKIAYNTFKTKHDGKEIFEESNLVKNSILHNARKVSIPVTKVWNGEALKH